MNNPGTPFDWESMLPPDVQMPIAALPRDTKKTTHLKLFTRLATIWCRANGNDYSPWIRKYVDAMIERIRSTERAANGQ